MKKTMTTVETGEIALAMTHPEQPAMKLTRADFLKCAVLPFAAVLAPSVVTAQRTVHAGIWIETLWCGHTTEAGEDEIYMLIGWKKSDGSTRSYRWPSDHGHIDMNDSGPKQNRFGINIMLWEGDLADGESVAVYTAVMEEDGGLPGDVLERISQGIGAVGGGNPITDIVGGVLGGLGEFLNLIGIRDTDDFPGSFAIQLKNEGGRLIQSWQAVERCLSLGVPPNHPEQARWIGAAENSPRKCSTTVSGRTG